MKRCSLAPSLGGLLLLAFSGCGPREPSAEDRAALVKADALFAQGDRQGAQAIYETALGFDEPAHRTLARLGIARIREVDLEYDTTLGQLRKLGVEMSSRPTVAASKAFEAVLTAARGQKRFAEIENEAKSIREKAKQNLKVCREGEAAKVMDWIEHNELSLAVLEIALIEARRPPGETDDLSALSAKVVTAADQHAANVLSRVPVDPKEAVRKLDSEIVRIGGTPAATVLVAERMKRRMEMYARKPTGPGVTGTDGH